MQPSCLALSIVQMIITDLNATKLSCIVNCANDHNWSGCNQAVLHWTLTVIVLCSIQKTCMLLLAILYSLFLYRTSRLALKTIEINGVTIPKGATIQLPIHLLQHIPELWPEPEKFDPERYCFPPSFLPGSPSIFPSLPQVHSWGEGKAPCCMPHPFWLGPLQLHWDEVCPHGY